MRQAQERRVAILGGLLWLASMGNGLAEPGFDEKYQRDFNIFNPINQYQSWLYVRYDILSCHRTNRRCLTDGQDGQPLIWLRSEVKTPPFSQAARLEAGYLLRLLQEGESLGFPHSRPMPVIGTGCHELRITDEGGTFRIIYRADADAVVILDVFRRRLNRRLNRSLRPADVGLEIMTE